MADWEKYFTDGVTARVPIDLLSFDVSNPRFTPDKRPESDSDASIIEYLDRTADLGELTQSIAASGYIDLEPLIVIPEGDKLVVIEGNRRLAALKALTNPGLAEQANLSVPDIKPQYVGTLKSVTVHKVASHAAARHFIGFKHINGPQGWDAYAKALYAASWLDEETAKGADGLSLTEIAAQMGDKHATLHRMVSAVYVLRQAEEAELFRVEDRVMRNFSFSHIYTALTYTEYRDFLGLPPIDRSANPPRHPVPADNLGKLKTVLLWLYGSKSAAIKPQIKSQNPDLSRLKQVLGHPVAQRVMLERGSLDEAIELTITSSDRFQKAIVDALAALRVASTEIAHVGSDKELLAISEEVWTKADFVHRVLKSLKGA